jgi:hypothetical protein
LGIVNGDQHGAAARHRAHDSQEAGRHGSEVPRRGVRRLLEHRDPKGPTLWLRQSVDQLLVDAAQEVGESGEGEVRLRLGRGCNEDPDPASTPLVDERTPDRRLADADGAGQEEGSGCALRGQGRQESRPRRELLRPPHELVGWAGEQPLLSGRSAHAQSDATAAAGMAPASTGGRIHATVAKVQRPCSSALGLDRGWAETPPVAAMRALALAVALSLVVAACVSTNTPQPSPSALVPTLQPGDATPFVEAGLAHLEAMPGLSFAYPAGWLLSYPRDASMMDFGLVTVASKPVLPPCSTCQRFSTPAGAIVIEFRIGAGPLPPGWTPDPSLWTLRVGGQPAHREDWGPENATAAQEGHTWTVWLGVGRGELGVYASLRGPDLPRLEAQMDQVIASIRIDLGQIPQS